MKRIVSVLCIMIGIMNSAVSLAWHDETHMAVAKAAGYTKWYNLAGPDIAKIKAGTIEKFNHYFNNPQNRDVTLQMVLDQTGRYDDPNDQFGHLYGAIIASLKRYVETAIEGKYAEYHLVYCAHYIGDLSNPLHNTPYDEFNKEHHAVNDGIVEQNVLSRLDRLKSRMVPIKIRKDHFDEDLALEVARIANISRNLGYVLREEKRNMTENEAYAQLGHSASLFRAILDAFEKH